MKKIFSIIRVGKRFVLSNFGEKYEFEVMRILPDGRVEAKDLHTLETYFLDDLIRFGLGKDYSLYELM